METNVPEKRIFVGDSEMAALMRRHDWKRTSLGDPLSWPESLKAAVRILLTSRFEMWLGWGPDVAFLYNDAYRPTLGHKHPHALATPTKELWAEIWDAIEPRLRKVYDEGLATWDQALLLILERAGYAEETYHTFSYSPLVGDTGKVEGVFCAVTEETDRVISERRLASLKALATALAGAQTEREVFERAAAAFALADRDILFSAIYAFDESTDARAVHASLGCIDAQTCAAQWRLHELQDGQRQVLVELESEPGLALPQGAWDMPARQAAVIALPGSKEDAPAAALVFGLNPFRQFDEDYQAYLKLLASQVAARREAVLALQSERARAAALAQALALRQEAEATLDLVNQRLTSEVQLRTQELERMRALFEQAPSFMALLSGPELVFELANGAYQRLVGQRELLGKSIREALPEIEGQGYFELLDRVYRTGEPFVGEALKVMLQRGTEAAPQQRYVNLVYQPVVVNGTVQGIFVDGYDVTHQRQAEEALRQLNDTLESRVLSRTQQLAAALEQLRHESEERVRVQRALQQSQKMEALGALTGGVAHDFNNILQVISANLHLLARLTVDNPQAAKRVDIALSGVARGAKLASQLLSFGRRQPLEPRVVSAGRFIRGMEDLLRRASGEGVELETVISGGLWNTHVDPGQIENAVLNLVINARDAMGGQGKLTIEAGNAMLDEAYCSQHEDVRAGQYVMIAVTDTGTGMPPEVIRRAFEPFFSTKAEGKGTGLGLSMVYGFVKQSGGHVMIYSEVGEGTTVKLYLPRSLEPEDVVIDPVPGEPVSGGTETILVVEDDDEVREATVATLADLGYRVLKARDADSALTVIDSGMPIDLLFTDVVMPGKLRSPELARKAVQRLPGIAVLFTSGYTENSIVHGGRLDPGVELLSKPYTRDALARRLRHVLRNQAQRNASGHTAEPSSLGETGSPERRVQTQRVRESRAPALVVLVVEDDELIRSTTAAQLQASGHCALQAGSGGEALALLGSQRVDVLVADIGLPDMSGMECARRALLEQPALGVVFASGADVDRSQVPGARCQVVLKPYSLEALLQACDVVLRSAG